MEKVVVLNTGEYTQKKSPDCNQPGCNKLMIEIQWRLLCSNAEFARTVVPWHLSGFHSISSRS